MMFFAFFPARRAVLMSVIGGYLLLPIASIALPGLPDYDKGNAIMLGAVMGVVLFDPTRFLTLRPRLFDLPILVVSFIPLMSSISNGLGLYDGLSASSVSTLSYGVPYLLGRIYFTTSESLRELVVGVLMGAIFYVPFCLWEIRMSPHLHDTIYGYMQTKFHMTRRLGGYRPMVFLQHGIALGAWMATGAMAAVWLWRSKSIRTLLGLPIAYIGIGMVVMLLMCRALNGYMMFIIAAPFVFFPRWTLHRIVLVILICAPVTYMTLRIAGWDAGPLVSVARLISPPRANSLQFRIEQEELLIDKAMERPFFGWGGWGRNRTQAAAREVLTNDSITDSLWIITIGKRGLVGLVAIWAILLLPLWLVLRRSKKLGAVAPMRFPAGVLAISIYAFSIDCLFNAMVNPVYILAIGAAMGASLATERPRVRAVASARMTPTTA